GAPRAWTRAWWARDQKPPVRGSFERIRFARRRANESRSARNAVPSDVDHARDAAHRLQHAIEVLLVADPHRELDRGGLVVERAPLRVAHVGLDGGERRGHRGERARAVLQPDGQTHLVAALGPRLPLDRDPPLGVVDQVGDVRAGERVHRDALAARDVADDRLAHDRVAALGPVDQEVVGALHLDAVVAAQQPLDRVDDGERLGGGRRLGELLGRQELREYLAHGHLAVADRDEQVVDARPGARLLRQRLERRRLGKQLLEREGGAPEFALTVPPADLRLL